MRNNHGGTMKIRWEVEDGYVGRSRPHYITVPDEDLEGENDGYRFHAAGYPGGSNPYVLGCGPD